MYEIPSSSSVKEVIIDKAVVETEKQPIVLHVSDKKINNIRKAS
jgi:ATP-dependent protease Clp ATPase subunit